MRSFLLAAAVVVAAGCDQPADPESVHDRISQIVPELVDQSRAALDDADATFAAIDQGAGALDVLAPGLVPAWGGDALERLAAKPARFGEDGQTGADVARELNEQVFTEAAYEGDGVYRIPTAELCPDPADTDCVDLATRAELRIRAELAGDGLDLALLVGASQHQPASITLRPGMLSVSVDLAALVDAVQEIAPADAPPIEAEIAGVVSARLDVLGAAHAAVAVTIDEPIHVVIAEQGGEPTRFDTGLAHPLVRLELDGVAHDGSAQLGLGSTQIHIPDDVDPDLDVDLPGLTMTASLSGGALAVTGLGLGDRTTTVSVGGQTAIAVDLNRDRGRTLDLAITGDDLDATFTVTPALDLRVAIDHGVLGDAPPVYDVTRVALDGAAAPAVRATTLPTGASQLAIAAGQLTVETDPVGYGVVIGAGQCVAEQWRSDANGDYSVLIAAACQ